MDLSGAVSRPAPVREPEESLCTFVIGDGDSTSHIEILNAFPSGRGLRLSIRQHGVRSSSSASALPGGLRDLASGELVSDPVRLVRLKWGQRICSAHGGWPLHHLIEAFLIDGFGATTAADIARAMRTWNCFDKSIGQLCESTIPASREEFILAHNARGRVVGVFEPSPDALDHALDLYPQPLSTLLDACGPRAWRGLQEWGRSSVRLVDVDELLAIARPLAFGQEDYDAFLQERFVDSRAS